MLQEAFEAKRIRLQQAAPLENPELVLVLEVIGSVSDFARAVGKVEGLEWLSEIAEEEIPPDEDFYAEDEAERAKPLSGRLYLLGTNRQALDQLIALWDRYQRDPAAALDPGLAPFKHVFAHLRAIRPWDVTDRLGADIRTYWDDLVESGRPTSRFEVEAWHFTSAEKNEASATEITALVHALEGRILSRAMIPEIAYHGLLVEVPVAAVRSILEGAQPQLLLSDRIMFFRPKAQSCTDGVGETEVFAAVEAPAAPERPPVVALLDGLPLVNHALLAGRLLLDDPDGWEAGYEVKDRVHGTAMASLILHGPLDGDLGPQGRRLYVRPVMRPDENDGFNPRRVEHTPDNVLLIDLIHRAIRRICVGEAGGAPVAPTVRIVNLSIGDSSRVFSREMSPWSRLLDWLAYRYSLLFVVSAGNDPSTLVLQTPRDSLGGLTTEARQALAFTSLTRESAARRLLSPAESLNALTVGAMHSDDSPNQVIPNRFDLFALNGLSPLSRVGHGYRRAIKPDILMPGGRILHLEQYVGEPEICTVEPVMSGIRPGHRTAIPPLPGGGVDSTAYCRGTSNAAALASRAAARIYDAIEELRAQSPNAPVPQYDAVLVKALLAHGAHWGDLSARLLEEKQNDFRRIASPQSRRIAEQDFIARWLGYGPVDIERSVACTDQRATLLGVGELAADEALIFSAPLPPSLAGTRAWRRVTITLAWISPINPRHQAYRRARLWVTRAGVDLRIRRTNSAYDKAALRGTLQHEIFEGEDAVAYVDGDRFQCKVNCAADAGGLDGKVSFALCVSLEVGVNSQIPIYREISERIAPPVEIRPV